MGTQNRVVLCMLCTGVKNQRQQQMVSSCWNWTSPGNPYFISCFMCAWRVLLIRGGTCDEAGQDTILHAVSWAATALPAIGGASCASVGDNTTIRDCHGSS